MGKLLSTMPENPWTLETLLAEINGVTDQQIEEYSKGLEAISDSDTFLGELPTEAIKAMVLGYHYHQLKKEVEKDINTNFFDKHEDIEDLFVDGDMSEDIHNLKHKVDEYESKSTFLKALTSVLARDATGWSCASEATIKENWKLVAEKPKTELSGLESMLKSIFG